MANIRENMTSKADANFPLASLGVAEGVGLMLGVLETVAVGELSVEGVVEGGLLLSVEVGIIVVTDGESTLYV